MSRTGLISLPHLILLFCVLVVAHSISLTVSSERERCMVLSTTTDEHLMKIDLEFRKFEGQAIEEGYRVVLHNTETHVEEAFQVVSGLFRRQFDLTKYVVYRLCFKIVLSRQRPITAVMEYHAASEYHEDFQPETKVPDSLLKIQQLQESYNNVSILLRNLQKSKESFAEAKRLQEETYEVQVGRMDTLKWVNIVEIAAVVMFGGYQYFRLKGIIEKKATE